MQVGAVLVFAAGPLALRHGGGDVERLRAYTAERLSGSGLLRAAHARAELEYHVRHASLPAPGGERELRELAGRVFSERLDRDRAPWELWLVEGLDGGRLALVAKHDAARGGVDPLLRLLAPEGAASAAAAGARPARGWLAFARSGLDALERALGGQPNPLAGAGDAQLRVDWLGLPVADLDAAAERLGATRQELWLAALASALRLVLARRGLDPDLLRLRVSTPDGVGGPTRLVALPVELRDPTERLRALRAAAPLGPRPTRAAVPFEPLAALARACAAARSGRPASLVAADLHAAPSGTSLCGTPLEACVPLPALPPDHALGVAALCCGSSLWLGFSADAARMRDLSLLVDGVAAAFDELRRLRGPREPRRARARPRRERTEHAAGARA